MARLPRPDPRPPLADSSLGQGATSRPFDAADGTAYCEQGREASVAAGRLAAGSLGHPAFQYGCPRGFPYRTFPPLRENTGQTRRTSKCPFIKLSKPVRFITWW